MLRALFQKSDNAIYISHLDLMRLFQRAFKRSGLQLTHTKGYNPRPSVSIALPLSLGVESNCELLDFELEDCSCSHDEIRKRLNESLISGVRVLDVYDNPGKLKNLAFLDCQIILEYNSGVPDRIIEQLEALFSQEEVLVEKKSKNGTIEQNIIPLIRKITIETQGFQEVSIRCMICCQNPTLNPGQIYAAICKYLPAMTPDFVRYRRLEVYDTNENVFR